MMLSAVLLISICQSVYVYGRETVYDAARIARNLVDQSAMSVGSMATTFPSDDARLPGVPFSLPEYYASCHQNASLTLLFLPISRHSRNILHAPGQTASISITSPRPFASQARVALIGNVTVFKETESIPDLESLRRCYLAKHPMLDGGCRMMTTLLTSLVFCISSELISELMMYQSYWARFDPHTIYFVGGFGDEHYIGYIPLELYQDPISAKLYAWTESYLDGYREEHMKPITQES